MDMSVFADKIGAEVVGGRVLAVVDGKKAWLSDIVDGLPVLNELGVAADQALQRADAARPKRAPRAAKAVDDTAAADTGAAD